MQLWIVAVVIGEAPSVKQPNLEKKMLKKHITFAILLGLFGFIGAQQAKAQDKAYVLVHIEVEDFDR